MTSTPGGGGSIPKATITAAVSGVAAQVTGISTAAGYPAGYMAIDIVIPPGAPEGDFVLVSIAADGTSSQPGVTASIR
jgi:uncharacterized protein (TIGR03437 family)